MEKLLILQNQHLRMAEVCNMLDERIQEEMDRGDDAHANYERFLEYTANAGYHMPVDEDPYFDFRNTIFEVIKEQLEERHNVC